MWSCSGQHSPGPNLRSRRPSALHPTLFLRRGVKTHTSRGREREQQIGAMSQHSCSIPRWRWHQTFWLPPLRVLSESAEVPWKVQSSCWGILTPSLQSVQLVSSSWKGNQGTMRTAGGAQNKSTRGQSGTTKPPDSAACLLCTITHSFVPCPGCHVPSV